MRMTRRRVVVIVALTSTFCCYIWNQLQLLSRAIQDDPNYSNSLILPNTPHSQRISNRAHSSSESTAAKIVFVGEMGLGHRLSKLSGAYHLAMLYNLTHKTHKDNSHENETTTM